MKGHLKDVVAGSGKIWTIAGTVAGAALAGATQYFTTSGGFVGSWKPYAVAAGLAVAGALTPGKKKK